MPGPLSILKSGIAREDDVVRNIVLAAANGALTIQNSTVFITKGTAAALTLAAPSTAQNGTTLTIISTTAAAHTVTNSSPGFNNAGASGDVATFEAAIGNSLTVVAYNGVWYALGLVGVTLA